MILTNVEKLTNNKFLNLYEFTYEDKQGSYPYYVASRRKSDDLSAVTHNYNSDAVTIVPITKDGNIILIKQFRQPLNTEVYELPSGLIDSGEDIISAVSRELQEETGYGVEKIMLQTPASPLSSGMSDELSSVVVVQATDEKSDVKLEREEEIEVVVMDLKDKEHLKQFLTSTDIMISMICRLILSSYL